MHEREQELQELLTCSKEFLHGAPWYLYVTQQVTSSVRYKNAFTIFSQYLPHMISCNCSFVLCSIAGIEKWLETLQSHLKVNNHNNLESMLI